MRRRQPAEGDLIINNTTQGDFKVALVLDIKVILPDIWNDKSSDSEKVLTVISSDGRCKRVPSWCLTWCFSGFWKVVVEDSA
jgi:hypothetical protein